MKMPQIVEQILPYFQLLNLTVNLVEQIGETRDIPMVLNSIQMDDDYEGDFTTRRSLVYTLDFTAKTYLFGPVDTGNDSIIKKFKSIIIRIPKEKCIQGNFVMLQLLP